MSRFLSLVCILWALSEIILAMVKRSKKGNSRALDRSSFAILWIAISSSVTVGVILAVSRIGFIRPGYKIIWAAGVCLIIVGLVIRWIAIIALRKYFTVTVNVESDHKLIDSGPYRYIRHPAYAGSLLSFLGLGLSFSNWLSALVIFIPILAAFLNRIRVEEEALTGAFGGVYLQYASKTRRLIPGIY
jgi:protein-S-isoprenylcysteine O-methyltransferase Ste14